MITKEKEAWYIGQRAESLAVMYLTRRNDLIVSRQQKDYGLDFLVTITQGGGYSGRLFGVEVKATASTPKSAQHDNFITIPVDEAATNYPTEFPFPVCLLFFTLDNDYGYYKWLLEPVVEAQHNPKLIFNQSNQLKKLSDEAIDDMISSINLWYDSRKSAQ